MKLQRFRRVLRQVSLLPVVVLGMTSCVLLYQIATANGTVALIQRSDQRITKVTLAARLIVDEETGVRGYEATGDRRFLEPYFAAQAPLAEVLQSIETIPRSIGPDGVPLHGIDDLRAAHRRWLTEFAEPTIRDRRSGMSAPNSARDLRGKELMDAVRTELAGVVTRAESRRQARIELWRRQVRWTEIALLALTVLAAAVIGLFTRNRMHWVSGVYRTALEDAERRTEEIFATEERLRTTIRSIGDGVITCDPEGRVQMMNAVAEELTGWTQEEGSGRPIEQVFVALQEQTRAPMENPVERARRLNRVVGLAEHTLLLRKDGKELQIADSGAPIRNQTGEILGFVMVFRDVTMQRRTQEALVAQEKLAVSGRLAATIAHEINNPLSSVLDLLYLLRDCAGELKRASYLEMAEAELTRVGQIVRAMLGLYRESQAPISVDLGQTIRDILLLMERRVSEMGVRVKTEVEPEVCVMGFPAELRQVFSNLMLNAAEAAGEGGTVWVSAKVQEVGTRLAEVRIRDSGEGIAAEVLPQLFTPFFTTKGERGTGLGLWVSRGIMAKHNGTVELTSSQDPKDHGTTAVVTMPAAVRLASPVRG